MSRKLHRPVLDTTGIVVPIKQGGSSADTLTQGAIALEMLTLDQIDLANRIPSLDATGHLSDTVVPAGLIFDSLHLEGPEIVAVNGTAKIYITDYDQYKSYAVSASAGFAAHSDGVIYFKAPSTTGPVTITVNDRDYTLTVDDKFIVKPSFILPTEDLANAGSALLAVSDDFEVYGIKSYKSLRFKASANAYLNRLIPNASGTTATFSLWIKRATIGINQSIFGWTNGGTSLYGIRFTNNQLNFVDYYLAVRAEKTSSATITDTNWHHIVCTQDTTNSVASDRFRIYIDGQRITSFSSSIDPAQNTVTTLATNINMEFGYGPAGSVSNFDGYMSEINFIDGQALDASYFGEMDADLGIWVPKVYEGTYGTNGFYLDFSDPSTLTDLCKDRSGNHNHWIPANISLASDTTYDSMSDSPISQYPTFDPVNKTANVSLTNGNLTASTSTSLGHTVICNESIPSLDGYYWEVTVTSFVGTYNAPLVGLAMTYSDGGLGYNANEYSYFGYNGQLYSNNIYTNSGSTYGTGDVIGVAVKNGKIWFSKNGVWQFSGNPNIEANPAFSNIPNNLYPAIGDGTSMGNGVFNINFGQRPFSYTPPLGFKPIITPILHDSTDWQLSDDADFSTVISESLLNTTKLTSWPVSDLDVDKDYFLRCRYHGSVYGQSEWSDVRHIKTRSSWLPVNEQQILTAADKVAADNFGIRVSISADGTRLVVGAYFADPSGLSAAGKAYIYVKTGGIWVQEAILTASDKATNDYFGVGVSMCADGTRVAIGAYNKTVGGLASAGAVYVFSRSGSTWTQEAILTASDKAAADQLGQGLAIDATGTRVVAGALESGANNAGAAYVFSRSGTVWAQEAKLTASDGASIDYLGLSASITANGDRVLVSSYGADVGGTADAGAAYVFVRSGTSWTQEAKLSASDKAVSDNFSFRVNISSDGTRAIIGAHNADPSGVASAGKAYIFIRSGSTWSEEAILTASNKAANDLFGADVNISSDGSIAAVAAYSSEFAGYTDCGVVYLFTRTGSTWSQQAILSASDKGNTSYFGHSLDMDETASTLLIGALNASPSGVAGAGSAYIFS